jgi:hypothetical protein
MSSLAMLWLTMMPAVEVIAALEPPVARRSNPVTAKRNLGEQK